MRIKEEKPAVNFDNRMTKTENFEVVKAQTA